MNLLNLVPTTFKRDYRLKNADFLNIPDAEQITAELAHGRLQQLPD